MGTHYIVLLSLSVFILVSRDSHATSVSPNDEHKLYFIPSRTLSTQDGNCTEMFPKDEFARWACRAQVAFQTNWFPSPISGLYSYQAWNGFDGFWQNGCVLETFANFMAYGGHQRYKTILRKSLREIYLLLEAYYPQPSFDDMAWYGLSYFRVYEVLGDEDFLQRAKDIYDWNWVNGWDKSGKCGGGMWFDQLLKSKVSITNVQMLHLGAKLYKATGSKNKTLLTTVNKLWNFIDNTNIINNQTFLVADGVDVNTCTRNEDYSHVYTPGVLAGGLVHVAEMYNNSGFMDLAHNIVNATIFYRSKNGILYEPCDLDNSCDEDALVFKGIFVRHLRYVMDASDNKTAARYRKWLEFNGNAMIKYDTCLTNASQCQLIFTDGMPYYTPITPVFDSVWNGPYNFSAPMQQASSMDLLVSLIYPGTECQGDGCQYDPPIPPLRPLTCKDSPCPPGKPCCEYYGGYRTCCDPDQKCVNGFCE